MESWLETPVWPSISPRSDAGPYSAASLPIWHQRLGTRRDPLSTRTPRELRDARRGLYRRRERTGSRGRQYRRGWPRSQLGWRGSDPRLTGWFPGWDARTRSGNRGAGAVRAVGVLAVHRRFLEGSAAVSTGLVWFHVHGFGRSSCGFGPSPFGLSLFGRAPSIAAVTLPKAPRFLGLPKNPGGGRDHSARRCGPGGGRRRS